MARHCTAGAFGAAVTAAVARGLDAERVGVAMALAVPAAGGVQRAFGTSAKSLQVGFAAEAGVRAAALAQAGASADVLALEDWMGLVGGDPSSLAEAVRSPAVPGGLAIKLYPCCYALQRPIAAVADLGMTSPAAEVRGIRVTTPATSLAPLIDRLPSTGLEGKFSLEYAIAAALLDGRPGLGSFTDEAVGRPEAVRLAELVETVALPGGADLLVGEVEIEVTLATASACRVAWSFRRARPGALRPTRSYAGSSNCARAARPTASRRCRGRRPRATSITASWPEGRGWRRDDRFQCATWASWSRHLAS